MHFTKINKNGKQCICMISYEYKSKGKNKDTLCIIPNRTIKLRKFKNHWYLGSIFFQDLFVAHFHLIVIRITEECCQMFLLVTIIWSCITSLTLTTENFHVRRGPYFLAPLLSQTPPFRCPARCSYSGFSREPPWQLCSPLRSITSMSPAPCHGQLQVLSPFLTRGPTAFGIHTNDPKFHSPAPSLHGTCTCSVLL